MAEVDKNYQYKHSFFPVDEADYCRHMSVNKMFVLKTLNKPQGRQTVYLKNT